MLLTAGIMKIALVVTVFLAVLGHEVLGKKGIDWETEIQVLFDGFSEAYKNQQFEDLVKHLFTDEFTRISSQGTITDFDAAVKSYQAMFDMGFYELEFSNFTILMTDDSEAIEWNTFRAINSIGPDRSGHSVLYLHDVNGKAKIKFALLS